jgi:hypothetical protein
MRKFLGALLATSMLLPVGLVGVPPAGAAASGTTCKSFSGIGVFSATLPKLGSNGKVRAVLTATGPVSGCGGGGVTSGSARFVSTKSAPENCGTLATAPTPAIKGTETITWSGGKVSKIAFALNEISGNPVTTQALSGTVTSGPFKGMRQKGLLMYAPLNGGCTTKGLSKISYKSSGSMVIK